MILKLTNLLPFVKTGTRFNEIERGTVFEYKEKFYIKVNHRSALMFEEIPAHSPEKNFWSEETFKGNEEITIIESELILRSKKR